MCVAACKRCRVHAGAPAEVDHVTGYSCDPGFCSQFGPVYRVFWLVTENFIGCLKYRRIHGVPSVFCLHTQVVQNGVQCGARIWRRPKSFITASVCVVNLGSQRILETLTSTVLPTPPKPDTPRDLLVVHIPNLLREHLLRLIQDRTRPWLQ